MQKDTPIEFTDERLDSLSSRSLDKDALDRTHEDARLLEPEYEPLERPIEGVFEPKTYQEKSASSKSERPTSSSAKKVPPIEGALVFLKNQLGPDIFALPYLFLLGGILPTFIIIILATLFYNHSLIKLLESADRDTSERISLLELSGRVVGPRFRKLVHVTIIISQSTIAITNYIFLYQFVDRMSCNIGWTSFCDNRLRTYFFIYSLLFVILLFKSINRIHVLTMWIALVTGILVLVVLADDFVVMFSANGAKGLTLVGSNPANLLILVGCVFYFIEGTNTVTDSYATSDDPNQTAALIFRALYVVVFLYSLFGFPGYLAYGKDTKRIMLLNLANKTFWLITQWVIWVFFLLSASDALIPVWNDLRSCIRKKEITSPSRVADKAFDRDITLFCFKALIIGLLLTIASFINDFVGFMSIAGNLMLVLLVTLIPLVIYQFGEGSHQRRSKVILRYVLMVFFSILGTAGLAYSIYQLITNPTPAGST